MTQFKKTDKMVSRSDQPRNTFIVSKPQPTDAEQLSKEVADDEAELEAVLEGLKQRQAQIADKKRAVLEAEVSEKLAARSALLDDAADWREVAKTSNDPNRAIEFLRKAKAAEAEAAKLGLELNLTDPQPIPGAKTKTMLSTSKAIAGIVGLFIIFLLMTYVFGSPIANNPQNSSGYSMMHNAPLRALLSFTLTFLSFLVSVFFLRVAFPQLYRIWHNRIDSERSLDSLISEAPAWAVLGCLFGLFFIFMWVFASFYQAMYM